MQWRHPSVISAHAGIQEWGAKGWRYRGRAQAMASPSPSCLRTQESMGRGGEVPEACVAQRESLGNGVTPSVIPAHAGIQG